MVDVDVMEDAKHPLSLYIDHELEAQVKHSFSFIKQTSIAWYNTILSPCAGSKLSVPEVHELLGSHACIWPGECIFTLWEAEYLRPVWSPAQGEGRSSESTKIQTGVFSRVTGRFYQIG